MQFNYPSVKQVYVGRWLAHNHCSLVERGFVGADMANGRSQLVCPTISQAARLARVNVPYVWWALRRQEERDLILRGVVPLVPPPAELSLPKPVAVSDSELIEVVRLAGPERAFKALEAVL